MGICSCPDSHLILGYIELTKFNNRPSGSRPLQHIRCSTLNKLQVTVSRPNIQHQNIFPKISPYLLQIADIGCIQSDLIVPRGTADILAVTIINLELVSLVTKTHRFSIAERHGGHNSRAISTHLVDHE